MATHITAPGLDLLERLDPKRERLSRFSQGRTLSLIARHAKSYQRIMEAQCNGPWQAQDARIYSRMSNEQTRQLHERHEAWCEKRETQLTARLEALVAELPKGYGVNFCGDPRGGCVFISTPDNRYDDWGQRGIIART